MYTEGDKYPMKKFIQFISLTMAGLMTMFSPMQNIQHGEAGCCAECALKREDEIEVVDEFEQTTEE